MEFVKQWVMCVCITLIISVIFSLLTPKGNMGKIYKIILALFIFSSFIIPLKDSNFDFDFPELDFSFSEEQRNSYEDLINSNINSVLEKGGYKSCIIDCEVEYSSEEITIDSLKISIPSQYDCDEVKEYVYENLGMIAEVYYLGD